MNTCDTCDHYRDEPWNAHCGSGKLRSTDNDGAMPGEGADAILTGPKFGCIHWKELQSIGVRIMKGNA